MDVRRRDTRSRAGFKRHGLQPLRSLPLSFLDAVMGVIAPLLDAPWTPDYAPVKKIAEE
jgi:hypothetical protein